MKDLNFFIVIIVMMGVMLLSGCGTKSMLCNVPEAKNSVVCKLSKKINTTPEAISKSLKIANSGGMALRVYEAREAEKFIKEVITEVKKYRAMGEEISYKEAIDYISEKKKGLSPKVQAIFVVIDTSTLSQNLIDMPLDDYDFKLFLDHLNAQLEVVAIFKAIAWVNYITSIV